MVSARKGALVVIWSAQLPNLWEVVMWQPLSSLTTWVVSSVLAGLETGPIADPHVGGFLEVNGTFTNIDVPVTRRTHALGINDAGHIVGPLPSVWFSSGLRWRSSVSVCCE
jgi:hypothetical protein